MSCSPYSATYTERRESFTQHLGQRVHGYPLRDYVIDRTAVILNAPDLFVTKDHHHDPSRRGTLLANFNTAPTTAMAAAIDSRGYFLTAAHCVTKKTTYLIIPQASGQVLIKKARVIWRGKASLSSLDLALLRIDQTLTKTFKWSAPPATGEAVIGAGFHAQKNQNNKALLQAKLTPFAGHHLRTKEKTYRELPYQILRHTSPIRKGDSGGPLTNTHGELLGINHALVAINFSLGQAHAKDSQALALRPDTAWLQKLIEADVARSDTNQ